MPKSIHTEITCSIVGDGTLQELEEHIDAIATELFKLDGGQGAMFHADPNENTVTFGFVVAAEDVEEAFMYASSTARAALHAAGTYTPEWVTTLDIVQSSQRVVGEVATAPTRELALTGPINL